MGKVCAPSACVELVGLPLPPGEQFERADGTMMSFGEDELMRISYHKAFEQGSGVYYQYKLRKVAQCLDWCPTKVNSNCGIKIVLRYGDMRSTPLKQRF